MHVIFLSPRISNTHTYEYNTKSYILYENKDENDIGIWDGKREISSYHYTSVYVSNIQPKQKP